MFGNSDHRACGHRNHDSFSHPAAPVRCPCSYRRASFGSQRYHLWDPPNRTRNLPAILAALLFPELLVREDSSLRTNWTSPWLLAAGVVFVLGLVTRRIGSSATNWHASLCVSQVE